jgi:hypothetical protein
LEELIEAVKNHDPEKARREQLAAEIAQLEGRLLKLKSKAN